MRGGTQNGEGKEKMAEEEDKEPPDSTEEHPAIIKFY